MERICNVVTEMINQKRLTQNFDIVKMPKSLLLTPAPPMSMTQRSISAALHQRSHEENIEGICNVVTQE